VASTSILSASLPHSWCHCSIAKRCLHACGTAAETPALA
jgi:hypothetical protein